jgi:hypothetical protein
LFSATPRIWANWELPPFSVRVSTRYHRRWPSQSFNLGNGRGLSVAEMVQTTEKMTGRPVRMEMRPRRAGDRPVLVSDSSARAVGLDAELPRPGSADRACVDMGTGGKIPNV